MSFGKCFKCVGIDKHSLGLLEGAYDVFYTVEIYRRFSADRGVDLCQKCGGNVVEIDASHIYRRGKAAEISHNTAADRDYTVGASELCVGHSAKDCLERRDALGALTLGNRVDLCRFADATDRLGILSGHTAVGDYKHLAVKVEVFTGLCEKSVPDRYGVGSFTKIHADRNDVGVIGAHTLDKSRLIELGE